MKKLIAVILVSILMAGVSLFANGDVLPAGVGRVRIMPGYTFSDSGYDRDGELNDTPEGAGAKKTFNLGFALEYGILDWLNAGVQFVPGVVPWSDIDYDVSAFSGGKQLDVNSNGVGDLKLGMAMQFLGSRGLFKNEKFRLSLTPGFKIPLAGPDFEKEVDKVLKGESPITGVNVEKHIFAVGAQLNVDYLPTKWLSVNFMTEIMAQPGTAKLKNHGLEAYANALQWYATDWGTKAGTQFATYAQTQNPADLGAEAQEIIGAATTAQVTPDEAFITQYAMKKALDTKSEIGNWEVQYSPQYTFMLDPGVNFPLGDKGMSVSCGLPVTFMTGPGETIEKMGDAGDPLDWYSLFMGPNVTLSLFNLPFPMEFSVQYSLPLAGKGVSADSTISASLIAYFQIPVKKAAQ
jgi:hypothetical protein